MYLKYATHLYYALRNLLFPGHLAEHLAELVDGYTASVVIINSVKSLPDGRCNLFVVHGGNVGL